MLVLLAWTCPTTTDAAACDPQTDNDCLPTPEQCATGDHNGVRIRSDLRGFSVCAGDGASTVAYVGGDPSQPCGAIVAADVNVASTTEDPNECFATINERVTASRLHFATDEIPLRNARGGEDYLARIDGLVFGKEADAAQFRKTGGAHWVKVDRDGTVSGRPPDDTSDTARVNVQATNALGHRDAAVLRIRMRPVGTPLVPTLRILSLNLWAGGSRVENHREKLLKVLLDQDVDAVGLQENDNRDATDIAQRLGWDYVDADSDPAVISRYPVTAGPHPLALLPTILVIDGPLGIDAHIRIDDEKGNGVKELALWSVHLPAGPPYGPYEMCFGHKSEQEIMLDEERSLRVMQMRAVLRMMSADLDAKDKTPVVLTGDFNSPSHLDYTPATADRHCGYAQFAWPTTVMTESAGLIDSFRVANPDPSRVPGDTWSPVYKIHEGGYGYDSHIGDPEPQDRIDYVHHAGELRVVSSEALAGSDGRWVSDHAGVLTTFAVM